MSFSKLLGEEKFNRLAKEDYSDVEVVGDAKVAEGDTPVEELTLDGLQDFIAETALFKEVAQESTAILCSRIHYVMLELCGPNIRGVILENEIPLEPGISYELKIKTQSGEIVTKPLVTVTESMFTGIFEFVDYEPLEIQVGDLVMVCEPNKDVRPKEDTPDGGCSDIISGPYSTLPELVLPSEGIVVGADVPALCSYYSEELDLIVAVMGNKIMVSRG